MNNEQVDFEHLFVRRHSAQILYFGTIEITFYGILPQHGTSRCTLNIESHYIAELSHHICQFFEFNILVTSSLTGSLTTRSLKIKSLKSKSPKPKFLINKPFRMGPLKLSLWI